MSKVLSFVLAVAFDLFRAIAPVAGIVTALAFAAAPTHAFAENTQEEFCAGFSEGFKTIAGNMVLVPLCPLAPLTPLGSTPYREGIEAGIAAAQQR